MLDLSKTVVENQSCDSKNKHTRLWANSVMHYYFRGSTAFEFLSLIELWPDAAQWNFHFQQRCLAIQGWQVVNYASDWTVEINLTCIGHKQDLMSVKRPVNDVSGKIVTNWDQFINVYFYFAVSIESILHKYHWIRNFVYSRTCWIWKGFLPNCGQLVEWRLHSFCTP